MVVGARWDDLSISKRIIIWDFWVQQSLEFTKSGSKKQINKQNTQRDMSAGKKALRDSKGKWPDLFNLNNNTLQPRWTEKHFKKHNMLPKCS